MLYEPDILGLFFSIVGMNVIGFLVTIKKIGISKSP